MLSLMVCGCCLETLDNYWTGSPEFHSVLSPTNSLAGLGCTSCFQVLLVAKLSPIHWSEVSINLDFSKFLRQSSDATFFLLSGC